MPLLMSADQWRAAQAAHAQRAHALTATHLDRRAHGQAHPVHDFLFVYYDNSPAKLARWYPGAGVILADAAGTGLERAAYHRVVDNAVTLDVPAFLAARGRTVGFVRELVSRTLERPGRWHCFGLHEWAMVYGTAAQRRHDSWPLRLGQAGTDAVVESHQLNCTHYDAYRFFTADAAPRNLLRPTRETQVQLEQPGCVHAGMDLYKWAYSLAPGLPGELVLDSFELARDLRELDMRASPYDLRDLGYPPIAIEEPQGKLEYAAAQRTLATRANALRVALLAALDALGS